MDELSVSHDSRFLTGVCYCSNCPASLVSFRWYLRRDTGERCGEGFVFIPAHASPGFPAFFRDVSNWRSVLMILTHFFFIPVSPEGQPVVTTFLWKDREVRPWGTVTCSELYFFLSIRRTKRNNDETWLKRAKKISWVHRAVVAVWSGHSGDGAG